TGLASWKNDAPTGAQYQLDAMFGGHEVYLLGLVDPSGARPAWAYIGDQSAAYVATGVSLDVAANTVRVTVPVGGWARALRLRSSTRVTASRAAGPPLA